MDNMDDFVDDACLCMLLEAEEQEQQEQQQQREDVHFSVSDDRYAEDLQLQEVIMASIILSSSVPTVAEGVAYSSPSQINQQLSAGASSSSTPPPRDAFARPWEFICGICMEPKKLRDTFQNGSCLHRFCLDCIRSYVEVSIQRQPTTVIRCPEPGCAAGTEPEHFKGILPSDIFERWSAFLAEFAIPETNRLHCPYQDCSLLMEVDAIDGVAAIIPAPCPYCRRPLCARCRATWHEGIGCDEFQALEVEERDMNDILLRNLARSQSWQRCPGCRFYVEKHEGCLHISCRCKREFCYKCGTAWTGSHRC